MSKLDDLIFGIRDVYDAVGTLMSRVGSIQFIGSDVTQVNGRTIVTAAGAATPLTATSTNGVAATMTYTLATDTNYALDIDVIASRTETAHSMAGWKFSNVQVQNIGGVASIVDASPLDDVRQNGTAWTVGLTAAGAGIVITFTGTAGQVVHAKATVLAHSLGGFA